MNVYECVTVSLTGGQEFSRVSYVIADDIIEADKYFRDRMEERFGAENYYDHAAISQKSTKPGYWHGEVFVYIDRVNMTRGILINKVDGGAVFMELKPLWRDDNEIPDRESYQNAGQGPNSPDRTGG